MSDAPRYLHRRSEIGYTHLRSKGLPGVGEAVSVEYQAELSVRAELSELRAARETLADSRKRVQAEVEFHLSRVRAGEKQLRRLDAGLRELDRRL